MHDFTRHAQARSPAPTTHERRVGPTHACNQIVFKRLREPTYVFVVRSLWGRTSQHKDLAQDAHTRALFFVWRAHPLRLLWQLT